MKKLEKFLLFIFLISCSISNLYSQKQYISGYVTDSISGEKLIGANVIIKSTYSGVATDNNGYFSLQITVPTTIFISFTGYNSKEIIINDNKQTFFNVSLAPSITGLKEFEIVSEKNIIKHNFNVNSLNSKEIEQLPVIGSRPDVIKAAQLLPGIEPMAEASSTLIVRGGNPGENSYLFDKTPIIYVNHIGGFMSVFNSDMINAINIYKGGFPAKYGDKLSSIVEITQKEGDKNTYKGTLSAGITDLSFSVEGPGGIKNSSFIVTGRKTFTDFIYLGLSSVSKYIEAQDVNVLYGFHDINAKYSWHPDNKNSFHFNLYEGDDYFNIWKNEKEVAFNETAKFKYKNIWGNFMTSAVWNRIVNDKIFVSNIISYTRYRLKHGTHFYWSNPEDTVNYKIKATSQLQNIAIQSNWKYSLLKFWNLEFGIQSFLSINDPNQYINQFKKSSLIAKTIYGINSAFYLENKINLFNILDANLGIRATNYYSDKYNKFAIEPRVNINFNIGKKHSINLSYMDINQTSHLLFTAGSIMNNEVWIPASTEIEPSNSKQISLGWRGEFYNGMFDAEVNVYSKKLSQLVAYKDGYTNLFGDNDWKSKVATDGIGNSKGIELMVRKKSGKATGFLSYTFSHSVRQFNEIYNGKEYVYDYNIPHSFSISASYKLNDKWLFNALWICKSGLPYTPVLAVHQSPVININGEVEYENVFVYGERNSKRMEPYHRLDLSAVYSKYSKKGRKVEWTFSLYNAYCKQNPYYYFYSTDKRYIEVLPDNTLYLYKVAFFPIIPSFSYKIYFNKKLRKNKEITEIYYY